MLGLLLASAGLGLLPACDVIKDPVPAKQILSAGRRDTVQLDSAETAYLAQPDAGTPVQRVLLEDYTGHTCGNCPRAAEKAHELEVQYGERLVVVATHVGYFADTTRAPFTYNFTTPAGNELNNSSNFNVDNFGLPQGMVNRQPPTGVTSPVMSLGNWATVMAAEMGQAPEQQLTVTALRDQDNWIRVKTRVKYLVGQPATSYRLVLNVVQDSLRGWQKDYSLPPTSANISDYLHSHILRGALTGTFGAANAANPVAGQEVIGYLRYQLPDKPWASTSCKLVAYLIEDVMPRSQSRVVQAAQTKIK